jgi:hypothetical protein
VSQEQGRPQILGLLGVGLDAKDGHCRITRAQDVLLLGGSEGTHETMQAIVIRFDESLRKLGKRLRDASVEEVIDLLHAAGDP